MTHLAHRYMPSNLRNVRRISGRYPRSLNAGRYWTLTPILVHRISDGFLPLLQSPIHVVDDVGCLLSF